MTGVYRAPHLHVWVRMLRARPILRPSLAAAPGVPSNVIASSGVNTIALSWATPLTGGAVDHYEVDIDGNTPIDVDLDLLHTFDGLLPSSSHTVRVRAVNAYGTSAWVSVTTSTLAGIPRPSGRTLLIHADDRTWIIAAGPRRLRIPAEDRTLVIPRTGAAA